MCWNAYRQSQISFSTNFLWSPLNTQHQHARIDLFIPRQSAHLACTAKGRYVVTVKRYNHLRRLDD